MSDEREIVPVDIRLGTLQATSPRDVVQQASDVAGVLAKVVNDRKLYTNISGRKYVRVEGWNTLGAMLGIVPRETEVIRFEDGSYQATVELIRVSDGAIIGRGSAIVGMDEPTWSKRAEYARRSMAITRATGKAFRLGFSWIMTLAGYEPTPAEEMVDVIDSHATEIPPEGNGQMTLEEALLVNNSKGEPLGNLPREKLPFMATNLAKHLKTEGDLEKRAPLEKELEAIKVILASG